MKHLLQISNLNVGRNQAIIQNIDMLVENGELIILSGLNGCGKSTLLKTISGIIPSLSGQIHIQETLIQNQLKVNSRLISFVNTDRIKEDIITVKDLVKFGTHPYWQKNDEPIIDKQIQNTLEVLGIEQLQDKFLNSISDGEWQKANIARSLVQNTPLVLMDEPSAFLDYPSKIKLFKDLKNLVETQNKLFIVSTHDIDLANQYGTRFWHIHNKKITDSRIPPTW